MNKEFFRFPTTPHLEWLAANNLPRDDKLLSSDAVEAIFSTSVVVEEKMDGANLGVSLSDDRDIVFQNRGQYLFQPYSGQFGRVNAWLAQHEDGLRSVLNDDLILFGEWCAARHSLDYHALPDWFLLFDVYDRKQGAFWSTARRDALAAKAGLAVVPSVLTGNTSLADLKARLEKAQSQHRPGHLEGFVVRQENAEWCLNRGKLVRPDFSQAIEQHWRSRSIEWNRVQY